MKHSIITWDCAFRNFFHLLPSLAEVEYDPAEFEVLVVQQRTKELADSYAAREELPTLDETIDSVCSRVNVRAIYLNEPVEEPYHPGRLLNVGLAEARGEILSTMDLDLLVPKNFLPVLDLLHQRDQRYMTMERYVALHPCGALEEDWKHQIIDYDLVLNTCPGRARGIPKEVGNKAPLISARRDLWQAVEGYDDHRLFSTAYTLFGIDLCERFKRLLGMDCAEVPLPIACVHPWHPTEVSRKDKRKHNLFYAQECILQTSEKQGISRPSQRREYCDRLYAENRQVIEAVIELAEREMIESSHGQLPAPVEA